MHAASIRLLAIAIGAIAVVEGEDDPSAVTGLTLEFEVAIYAFCAFRHNIESVMIPFFILAFLGINADTVILY